MLYGSLTVRGSPLISVVFSKNQQHLRQVVSLVKQLKKNHVIYGNTHSYSLHFQEDSSLEGLLPDSQVSGQLYPEGVALAMADQNTEAQRLIVLLLRRMLKPQVEPRLEPAVLCHPQL